jgi:hypothetical protein
VEQNDRDQKTPQSPEGYPKAVREQLDQREQTHEGERRPPQPARPGTMQGRGATEKEVTPIKPPMRGPGDLLSHEQEETDDDIDPRDELTPG